VSDAGVFVMEWNFPSDDFAPGRGLTVAAASRLDIPDVYQFWKDKTEVENE